MKLSGLTRFFLAFSIACLFSSPAFAQKTDVFLLFDDSESSQEVIDKIGDNFEAIVAALEAAYPEADFAFGIGRYEDYGGEGWNYCTGGLPCAEDEEEARRFSRPFILNQPLTPVTDPDFVELLAAAFANDNRGGVEPFDTPTRGLGGDQPESNLEALFQAATGLGFDGDGDGDTDSGGQDAGEEDTQILPDGSGDVPVGGADFRPDARKLLLLFADFCSVTPLDDGTDTGGSIVSPFSEEAIADFGCSSTDLGVERFGLVGDSKSAATNSIEGAVAPSGAATLQTTVQTLNDRGIRVIGAGLGASAVAGGFGPARNPSRFLSAIARLTGGVDREGQPIVVDSAEEVEAFVEAIIRALEEAASPELETPVVADPAEIDSEALGCGFEDDTLAAQFFAISDLGKQARKLGVRSVNLQRKAGVKKKKVRRLKRGVRSDGRDFLGTVQFVLGALQSDGLNLCVDTAEAEDFGREFELGMLNSLSQSLFKAVGKSFRKVKKGNTSRKVFKKAKRFRKNAKQTQNQIQSAVGLLP